MKQSWFGQSALNSLSANFLIVFCCIAIKLYAIFCFCQNCSIITKVGKVRIELFFFFFTCISVVKALQEHS